MYLVGYNVENWAILSDRKLLNFTDTTVFGETRDTKTDIIHRKVLKFIFGVSKSCPNIATYGETGEIPLSLKGCKLRPKKKNSLFPKNRMGKNEFTRAAGISFFLPILKT